MPLKTASKYKSIYKLSSDDKISSSLIKQAGILLITSGNQMSINYTPCFNIIDFAVISFYKELHWYYLINLARQCDYYLNGN